MQNLSLALKCLGAYQKLPQTTTNLDSCPLFDLWGPILQEIPFSFCFAYSNYANAANA